MISNEHIKKFCQNPQPIGLKHLRSLTKEKIIIAFLEREQAIAGIKAELLEIRKRRRWWRDGER